MTERKIIPHKLEPGDRAYIDTLKQDMKNGDPVYKRLYRHYKAICQQYNDPVHYYGEQSPSDLGLLRADLATDIAAFEVALVHYAPKDKKKAMN